MAGGDGRLSCKDPGAGNTVYARQMTLKRLTIAANETTTSPAAVIVTVGGLNHSARVPASRVSTGKSP